MGIVSVDELLPGLRMVQSAVQNYPNLPQSYTGLAQIGNWVNKMSGMRATDDLSEEDARQLKFELESAMQSFEEVLGKR